MQIIPVSICLMNILFIIKVKILMLIKWLYTPPLHTHTITLTIDPGLLSIL